jgi:four helix bundle protein
MRDFKELEVWSEFHAIALAVYRLTRSFPREELYGLTSQMRRAASSVPTNIAEGCGRDSSTELARFLQIAMGSASELEYQLILARDLDYAAKSECDALEEELLRSKRRLNALIRKIRDRESSL